MKEYIKRIDAMLVCEVYSNHCFKADDSAGQDIADKILDTIGAIPTADVREVKHGEWIFGCVHQDKKFYKCTNCHHAFPFNNVNFCPNCGAIMDGGNSAKK